MYYDNPRISKKLNKRAKVILIEKLGFDEYNFDDAHNVVIEFEDVSYGFSGSMGQPDLVQPAYDYLSGEVMWVLSDIIYDAELEHSVEIFKHRLMNPHDVFKYAEMYL